MKHLNWKNDDGGAGMVAWASRAVGGKYQISRHEDAGDGVWFQVEHLVHSGGSGRYADWWRTPVRHQPIARTYAEAIAAAEADNDQRRAIKKPA